MSLTTITQLDRACGVLLATAAGDALGAGYEFGPPLEDGTTVSMTGGGTFGWAPGEWTDDTSMALAIAEVAASGTDLRAASAQDVIVARWGRWAETARDVGSQTRQVLGAVRHGAATAGGDAPDGGATGCAAQALAALADLHQRTGHTAGNGSLMRTAPVALAYLGDGAEGALTDAAAQLSALTHHDPEAGEACVLWCHLIRHAVRTGSLDAAAGLRHLRDGSRSVWAHRLDDAEHARPGDFTRNGWVVEALQAAWSAITTTPVPVDDPAAGTFRADHLRLALESAVRGGRVVLAGRFYPSSKTCSACGTVKATLPLAERTFRCGRCGLAMDRDVNAARNLLHLAVSGTESRNACGETVRPRPARHVPAKQEPGTAHAGKTGTVPRQHGTAQCTDHH